MRFSRHAQNRMRLYKVSREQTAAIVAEAIVARTDSHGNRVVIGRIEDGRELAL